MSINTEVRPADAEGIARAAELLRAGPAGPDTSVGGCDRL